MSLTPEQLRIFQVVEDVFFNQAARRRDDLYAKGRKLVHYTAAENALNIIKTRSLWMRETRCMTDFSEVTGGHQLLLQYMNAEGKREKFIAALDKCFEGAGREVLKRFDDWWIHIQTSTYISCFSEHIEPIEDKRGRLSMWRAFGQRAGVAMVFQLPERYAALPLRGCLIIA